MNLIIIIKTLLQLIKVKYQTIQFCFDYKYNECY